MSYTKGPWTKEMGTTEFHKVPMLEAILGPNQELVIGIVIFAYDYELNISEANSNLILKAPDMYEAIKAFLERRRFYDVSSQDVKDDRIMALRESIRGIE